MGETPRGACVWWSPIAQLQTLRKRLIERCESNAPPLKSVFRFFHYDLHKLGALVREARCLHRIGVPDLQLKSGEALCQEVVVRWPSVHGQHVEARSRLGRLLGTNSGALSLLARELQEENFLARRTSCRRRASC